MDRGTWRATVHRVTKSRTRLSDCHTLGGFKVNSPPSLGDPEKEEEIGIIQTRSDFLLELAEQSSGPLTACPSLQQLGPLRLQHKLRGFPSGMD